MKRQVVQSQLVHEVALLVFQVAFGQQLAGVVVIAAKRGQVARQALALSHAGSRLGRFLSVGLHRCSLHKIAF